MLSLASKYGCHKVSIACRVAPVHERTQLQLHSFAEQLVRFTMQYKGLDLLWKANQVLTEMSSRSSLSDGFLHIARAIENTPFRQRCTAAWLISRMVKQNVSYAYSMQLHLLHSVVYTTPLGMSRMQDPH